MKHNYSMYLVVVAITIILSGCATKPVLEDQFTPKSIKHPAPQVESTVSKGRIAHLSYNYDSLITHSLDEPVNMYLMLGKVKVSTAETLFKGTLDNKEVICTITRAYSDLLTGPLATVCFFDPGRTGKVIRVTAAPGSVWFEKDLEHQITYSSKELFRPQIVPIKKELLYSGFSDSHISFLYREYYNDADAAKINQPVLIPLGDLPSQVNIKGAILEILAATDEKLTYKVVSGFEP